MARARTKKHGPPSAKPGAGVQDKPFYRPFAGIGRAPPSTQRDGNSPSKSEGNDAAGKVGRASGGTVPQPKGSPSRPVAPPPPQRAPRPEPALDVADADTFAIYMSGVRSLDEGATRIPRTASRLERSAPDPTRAAIDADLPARESLRALVSEGIRFEVSDDGEYLEGRRLDVEPRELRRLRRGQYAVDGKLDLHGMSALDARRALEAFLRTRRESGDRVVVIVHGKGRHSPGGVGLLRGEIGAWLSQGRASRDVAAFASVGGIPVATDTGDQVSGALYVLLAR